jgi:hypothetical protein
MQASNMTGRRSCPLFLFFCVLTLIKCTYLYCTLGFLLRCEWFTAVSVHRGVRAKTTGQTCTRITCTCDGCGVTGGGYGVTQSQPRCDPCYTLPLLGYSLHLGLFVLIWPSFVLLRARLGLFVLVCTLMALWSGLCLCQIRS